MAKQGMGKSMDNHKCGWVRPRIPLCMNNGDGSDRPGARGEGRELSARDLRQIERHLAGCVPCRDYRASMAEAFAALATAATQLPLAAEGSSLWPVLERRIAVGHANAASLWPGAGRCSRPVGSPVG